MKYTKTELGQQAFKERSPLLSAKQRSAFIMIDGAKTQAQVLAATAGLGMTQADMDQMVELGFIAPAPDSGPAPASEVLGGERTESQRYAEAYRLATQLTASLGLRGFKLNLAVEAASGYADLLALLPKIQDAVGVQAAADLEKALKG